MARPLTVEFEQGVWAVRRGRRLLSRHLSQQDAINSAMAAAAEAGLQVEWTDPLGDRWRTSPARGGWFSGLVRGARLGNRVAVRSRAPHLAELASGSMSHEASSSLR